MNRAESHVPPDGSVSTTPAASTEAELNRVVAAHALCDSAARGLLRLLDNCDVEERFNPPTVVAIKEAMDGVRAALAGTATTPRKSGEWEAAMRGLLGKQVEVVLQRDPRETATGVLHEFDFHGQARLGQEDGTWLWCWPVLGIDEVEPAQPNADGRYDLDDVLRESGIDPALIGTHADPEFRAHQDHKHAVEGCGYCPSSDEEGA